MNGRKGPSGGGRGKSSSQQQGKGENRVGGGRSVEGHVALRPCGRLRRGRKCSEVCGGFPQRPSSVLRRIRPESLPGAGSSRCCLRPLERSGVVYGFPAGGVCAALLAVTLQLAAMALLTVEIAFSVTV